jgi:anaerobic selenocysteine-containing dehydrogenase
MAEHKVFSACPHDCPDTCAMITTVRDGKAIDVRGNPDHPFTRGGLCVKVNDYQKRVYSPDRVLYPLKRTGRKGACSASAGTRHSARSRHVGETSSTGTAQLPSSPTAISEPRVC